MFLSMPFSFVLSVKYVTSEIKSSMSVLLNVEQRIEDASYFSQFQLISEIFFFSFLSGSVSTLLAMLFLLNACCHCRRDHFSMMTWAYSSKHRRAWVFIPTIAGPWCCRWVKIVNVSKSNKKMKTEICWVEQLHCKEPINTSMFIRSFR